MKREEGIKAIKDVAEWDVLIIGGGATGLGAAVDSVSRGYKTVLLEQHDFAKATSSRSTKLIHGGLRYLQQGNIHLVREALSERGILCRNAPHLVHHLPFLVPLYHWWETPFYGVGLKLYDMLAGRLGLEPSHHLNRRQTIKAMPTLHREGLRGGVIYYDGQFDDSRLAITLAQTAASHGAAVLNYCKVTSLIKKKGSIVGVRATDLETGEHYDLQAKVVINAAGIFSDEVRHMDAPRSPAYLALSQGSHLVLPSSFLTSKSAMLIPHTDDGRVIFLVPWYGRVVVGTTDIPLKKPTLEPIVKKSEIDFLLKQAGKYLTQVPTRRDILSCFAGIRPLVRAPGQKGSQKTSKLARDHVITVSPANLVTIVGGKWTTYRKMAEQVIDQAIKVGKLPLRSCSTSTLKLFGYAEGVDPQDPLSVYGSQKKQIQKQASPSFKKRLLPSFPYTLAHVAWGIDHEMARSVEDVLSRRLRLLLLDAKGSMEIAPEIAHFIAQKLSKSKEWEERQIKEFSALAKRYLPAN